MSTLDLFASKIKTTLYNYNNGISQLPLGQLLKECQNELDDLSRQFSRSPTDDGKNKIREIKRAVENKIEELRKLSEKGIGDKKDLESRKEELKAAITELDVLLNSDMNFEFDDNASFPKFEFNGSVARVSYNGTEASLLHELKHAFQFLKGKLDFIVEKGLVIPGITYDITDEIEAYIRQYAYDGILRYREELDIEKGKTSFGEDAKNDFRRLVESLEKNRQMTDIKEIKNINRITIDVIVKIADSPYKEGIYRQIPRTSLDKNSLMKDLKTLNVNRSDYRDLNRFIFRKAKENQAYTEFIKIFVRKNTYIYVR